MKLLQIGVNGFAIDLGSDILEYDANIINQAETLHKLSLNGDPFRVISEEDYQYILKHGKEPPEAAFAFNVSETSSVKDSLEYRMVTRAEAVTKLLQYPEVAKEVVGLVYDLYEQGKIKRPENTFRALTQIFIKGRVTKEDYLLQLCQVDVDNVLYSDLINAKINEHTPYTSSEFAEDMFDFLTKSKVE